MNHQSPASLPHGKTTGTVFESMNLGLKISQQLANPALFCDIASRKIQGKSEARGLALYTSNCGCGLGFKVAGCRTSLSFADMYEWAKHYQQRQPLHPKRY